MSAEGCAYCDRMRAEVKREQVKATTWEDRFRAHDAMVADLQRRIKEERERCERLTDTVMRIIDLSRTVVAWASNADWTHDILCNGVHSPDGKCEGEHLVFTMFEDLKSAIRKYNRETLKE